MKILDWFLPARWEGRVEARTRGRLTVGAAWGLALAVFVGLPLRMAIGDLPSLVIALALLSGVLFLAIPWILRTTGSLQIAGILSLLSLALLIVGIGSMQGGLNAPVIVMAPLLPLLGTFLLGARAGTLVTLLLMMALALLYFLAPSETITSARGLILGITVLLAWLVSTLYERLRRRAVEDIRKSRELYRRIFDQSKDIVALSTPRGELIDINPAGVQFYGVEKEELLERGIRQFYAAPEEREALLAQLETDGYVQGFETRQRPRSGNERILQGTTSTVRDTKGDLEFILAILRDVTEERQKAEERERLVALLEQRSAELERFAYSASHDLKSPLFTIKGFLGLLERDVKKGDAARIERDLSTLGAAVDQLTLLVEDLLAFSLIGRGGIDPVEVAMTDLAQEVANLLAGPIAAQGVELEIQPDLPSVQGDRTLLRMVLQNLFDNGIKFSSGAASPRIVFTCRGQPEGPVFTVADNGIGIAADSCEKVFEVFEKLHTGTAGTGIGLASVKRGVEAHGGCVWVESAGEGEGSTFCFTIP